MAGPFVITGAFAPLLSAGCHGAYLYSGNLYAIGFTDAEPVTDTTSTIGIFKSTDSGVTWSQVGGTKTTTNQSTMGGDSFPRRSLGACIDANFPTSPYVYAGYANSAGELTVSQVDLSADDWGATASGGPDLTVYTGVVNGATGRVAGFCIEQDRDSGEFSIAFTGSTPTTTTGNFAAVYLCNLGAGLSGWSGPTLVPGQDDINHGPGLFQSGYSCCAMAKGTSGRVHAFVHAHECQDDAGTFLNKILHFFAAGGPGFFGSAFTIVATSGTANSFGGGSLAFGLADGTVGVLYTDSGTKAAVATSADLLSWSLATVDGGGIFEGFLADNAGTLEAIEGDGTGINAANYTGSWGSTAALFPYGTGFSMYSGTIESGTLHLIYSDDAVDLVYASYTVTGGTANCGEASTDPVPVGCGDVNTTDVPDAPQCVNYGFAI